MSRTKGSNRDRISKNENAVSDLKTEIQDIKIQIADLQKQQDEQLERAILDDLEEETYYKSGRPLYTFDDIAERWSVSKAKVQRIAESAALEGKTKRRGRKII